jgi:hypothetical protein
MGALNLNNELEKLRRLRAIFWKVAMSVFLCGIVSVMFCFLINIILPDDWTGRFFDDLVDRIILIMMLIETALFIPFFVYGFYKECSLSKKLSSSLKIIATNGLSEIGSSKADELKYTERDVMEIVNRVIKGRDYSGNTDINPATSYTSAMDSYNSGGWDYRNRYTDNISSHHNRYHHDRSNRSSSDYHNCHCNPSHPSYKARHST